jgi:hypothetical protein
VKRNILTILTLVAVLLLAGWTLQRDKFEYRFEDGCSEQKANELGTQGWELVSIESPARKIVAVYVFKRQK